MKIRIVDIKTKQVKLRPDGTQYYGNVPEARSALASLNAGLNVPKYKLAFCYGKF